MMNSQQVRASFWQTFCVEGKPQEFRGKSHNEFPADVRMAFVDYVDGLHRDGQISDAVAFNATLA